MRTQAQLSRRPPPTKLFANAAAAASPPPDAPPPESVEVEIPADKRDAFLSLFERTQRVTVDCEGFSFEYLGIDVKGNSHIDVSGPDGFRGWLTVSSRGAETCTIRVLVESGDREPFQAALNEICQGLLSE